MSAPLVVRPRGPLAEPHLRVDSLLEVWKGSLSPATRRAYAKDLGDYAAAIGAPNPHEAVDLLLAQGKLRAEQQVLAYLQELAEVRKLSPATVGRRRAALRSVTKMAEGLGLIQWSLTAPLPRSMRARPYRDVKGPGLAAVQRMRAVAATQGGVKGLRDVVLLGTLYGMGLRRGEVCQLDLGDYDPEPRTLAVIGKGQRDPVLVTVPEPLARELNLYLEARGLSGSKPDVPLFASLDRAHKGDGRLTPDGLFKIVRWLAKRAGVTGPVSPHRIRHSAVTDALDNTKGDIRRVRSFARHAKIETTVLYDDRRIDIGGEIASMLTAALGTAEGGEAAAGEGQ